MSREKIREHIQFFGTVQGVGFRFQAMMAAEQLGLTGYVKNEGDGSVTMEIQGGKEEIDAALDMIGSSRFIEIEKTLRKQIPLDEYESGFSADYW
ncbi:MAG: acylphosphatase [Erysipelotrichaceae bacterium]|nr:acylphosphatase [Erysipelotrichaceae bacterium]